MTDTTPDNVTVRFMYPHIGYISVIIFTDETEMNAAFEAIDKARTVNNTHARFKTKKGIHELQIDYMEAHQWVETND